MNVAVLGSDHRLASSTARLVALLAIFLALCLAYNVATPIFEAPDERDHFSYASWLADGRGLPHMVADRGQVGELWQPPLYYALIAAAVAPIDRSDLATVAPLSADWQAGASRVAHYHGAAERFPYRGTTLAVHLARFVSSLLGAVTVWCAYAIARHVIPGYALVAAALVAFNPQFIFISGAINNDNLVIALASVVLWLLVRSQASGLLSAHRRPAALSQPLPVGGETAALPQPLPPGEETRRSTPWAWYILLGLLWGLAALAKLTGATLGLVIGVALLVQAWRQRSWRPVLGGVLAGATAALAGGWWFWRNVWLYGDPLAWQQMLDMTAPLLRPELLSWPETAQYAASLRRTYWAMFGYGVPAPEGFYWMAAILMALSAVGLVKALLASRPWNRATLAERLSSPNVLLVVWTLTVALFLARWMRQIVLTNQGRLLFPVIAGLAVLMAQGLAALDSPRRWVAKGAAGALAFWAAAMPLLVIRPAYAPPPALAEPAGFPNALDVRFGDGMALRGYELPAVAAPGQPVEVALYWQGARPMSESYTVAVRILDPDGQVATGVDAPPYAGRYPTLVWEPGRAFRDVYRLPPVADATPGLGTLLVTVYPRGEPGSPLPVAVDGAPAGHEVYLDTLKLASATPARYDPPHTLAADFDGRFRLFGYSMPDAAGPLTITLYWEAIQPDGRDYTVFVHVLDGTGQLIAQADGPPVNGGYPTSIWSAGEQIEDERVVSIPPGAPAGPYRVRVGLYDPTTGQRLPVYDRDGARYVEDAVELGIGQ